MKKIAALSFALVLPLAALSTASADEAEELKDECRRVGEQHGIGSERMQEWIDRCMENIHRLQRERGQQGQHGDPHRDDDAGQRGGGHGH